jgi:hypothetical protein
VFGFHDETAQKSQAIPAGVHQGVKTSHGRSCVKDGALEGVLNVPNKPAHKERVLAIRGPSASCNQGPFWGVEQALPV